MPREKCLNTRFPLSTLFIYGIYLKKKKYKFAKYTLNSLPLLTIEYVKFKNNVQLDKLLSTNYFATSFHNIIRGSVLYIKGYFSLKFHTNQNFVLKQNRKAMLVFFLLIIYIRNLITPMNRE